MKIKLTSVLVQDQEQGLRFSTEVLGFTRVLDIPMGEFRWLTVVSPEEPEGIQWALEPNANPAGPTFQRALFEQGIPLTAFAVEDIEGEHQRLRANGVVFREKPVSAGGPVTAVFGDSCGNLIRICQV
jgi:catechol 2,3-dioxygenase-like lactoylglutathione lyase family enzyme